MTCIVGLRHGGKVTIGGDSAGVAGYGLSVRADEKVFTRKDSLEEEWAFGYTSSFRMGQLIRFNLTLPEVRPKGDGLFEFMATRFVDAVRTCLKAGGYATKDSEAEHGGTFLVGFRGRLFLIGGDYQVGEPVDDFLAVGCGEDVALGAMHASLEIHRHEHGEEPLIAEDHVLRSLRAAERWNAGVRAPFRVVTV